MKVIVDHAPGAIKENVIKNYFGRKIAIDASMSLYQFLIAVRPDDTNTFTLTNDVGETTSYVNSFSPTQARTSVDVFLGSPCLLLTSNDSHLPQFQTSHRFLLSYYPYGRVWYQACLRVRWKATDFEEWRSTCLLGFNPNTAPVLALNQINTSIF